jgi:RND family efflux transporter MFP subunit
MSRKTVLWIAALSLAGLLLFRLYQELGAGDAEPGSEFEDDASRVQPVEAAAPERSSITERLSLIGSLRAKQRVEIMPKVSGRLVELRVDRGDRVRAGQIVARLEDDELRQQVRRAEAAHQVAQASLAQRRAELANRETELERYRNLSADGVVSSQQLETAVMNVEVTRAQMSLADAQIAQAKAELEELRIRLGQTEIASPLTGVVATRFLDAGTLVSSTTPIFLILDLSTMITVVNVPEREVNKIGVESPARVTVDALAGEEFEGRVVRISPILDPQTRTAPVEIELENAGELLKAEMFARVDLSLETEREALMIPRDALVHRSDRQGVFLLEGETVRFQPVVPGLTEGDLVEIVEGLDERDIVVGKGANLLQNGDPVQLLGPEGE